MRQGLALLLLLTLATIYPVPSCRYKTYAQESGDIVAVDSNAGIMTLAAGDVAYLSLDRLIKAKAGSNYSWWCDIAAYAGTSRAETYRFDYILKDIPDDDGYDSWFYYGCLIGYTKPENGSVWKWNRFVFSGELHKMSTGAWAVKKSTVAFGLPGYVGTNDYKVTYDEGSEFFTEYVDCLRTAFELQKVEDNDQTSIFNVDGRYDNYINWAEHDTDNGGVNNLAEWVRGTLINDVYDDKPQGGKCLCGACCECECKCGKWSGAECDKTPDDCKCHKPPCICADACCACTCVCESCGDGEHATHKNGSSTCDGGDDLTIGFIGCFCHTKDDPQTCTCAKYCCLCTCECEKCGDGEHSAHGNSAATCNGGCDCHKPDDPDEEECACANYCCACTCECEKCGDGEHSAHKNDNGECDGSFENCPDCHEEENPDDEECSCAKYCCYHTCECKVCASAPAEKHSAHKNNSPTCDGTTGSAGCACHEEENPDDEECTCANYCCYHTCKCKRCASLPAKNHSAHENGSPTCDGTTGSAGCSCHTSTGDENDQVELPEEQDYEVPEEKRKDSFLPGSSFKEAFNKLKSEIARKFGLEKLSALFAGDLSGELPSWSFTLPYPLSGTVVLDLNELLDYSFVSVFRCVLVFWVYYFTAITVFNSLRRLL